MGVAVISPVGLGAEGVGLAGATVGRPELAPPQAALLKATAEAVISTF